MTVSNTVSRNQYTASSGQTVFPYTFEVFVSSDITVLQNDTTLSEGSNYSVSGVGVDAGGDITLTVGATTGDIITVYRSMELDRTTDYQNSGDFLAQEVNDDFDRLWLAAQQGEENHVRAVVKPITDAASIDMTLPAAADRAETVLGFDATGAPVVGPSVADVTTLVDLAADIATLADIEDGTVATNAISDTAAIASNITTVAGISSSVVTVSGNTANINTVAGISADVTTVAGVAPDVDALGAVASDIPPLAAITSDITIAAANVADITNFADVYQGGKAADPTLRNDGSALQAGDLYFNTTNDELRVYSGSIWQAGTAGTVSVQDFTGDGSDTTFVLASAPSGENNTQVYIDGVYQQKNTYSLAGSTITFSEAPPDLASIEVVTISTLALGQTDSSLTLYTPAGTGAVQTTVQTKLRESVSVKDFGAVGDGVTDDTAAIQAAIDYVIKGTIIFPDSTGSYKTTAVFSSDTDITMLFTGQYGISGSATPTNAVYVQGIPTVNNLNATGIFKIVDSSGVEQLRVATDYDTNAFVGQNAGQSNTPLSTTEGRQNTFVGSNAGRDNTTGYACDNFGFAAGVSNTTGSRNTNIGYQAGFGNVSGNDNVNLGTDAGSTNTSDHNVFIGFHSGFGFPPKGTGESNIFIGSETALNITSAHNNTLVGRLSGYDLTTGYDNVTLGSSAGRELEDGYQNVLLGKETGRNLTSGYGNCLTGFRSGFYANGYLNSSIGSFSLFKLTTGAVNTAIGASAGYEITTGAFNTFIGYQAGFGVGQLATASYSMALGWGAVTTKNNQAVIGGTNIGETVLRGDVLAPKIKIGGTAAEIVAGTGTPEGVVIAQIGSIYMRVDGSTGTTLYVKESGIGFTGWVAK